MTPRQYVEELERRFRSDDPRNAYVLWLDQRVCSSTRSSLMRIDGGC
jgi:hypothetical protein